MSESNDPGEKMSPYKLRKQTRARKRMEAIVASFQQYVAGYDKQLGYLEYLDRTLVDDMLFGLGRAMDPKAYGDAQGYDKFKIALAEHLRATGEMPLATVTAFRLPDGARIERTNASRQEMWAVFNEGRVLLTDGKWAWARVPSPGDDEYLRTCRYGSSSAAYEAWRVALGASAPAVERGNARGRAGGGTGRSIRRRRSA